jgi:hypothetical protein
MPNQIAMIALIVIGSAFLIAGPLLGDRSFNWVNIALAAVCIIGAFLLRRRWWE